MSDNSNWAGWLGAAAAAMTICWVFFKHLFSAVTREELAVMHEQNLARIDKIAGSVERMHDRIDQLYRDMVP